MRSFCCNSYQASTQMLKSLGQPHKALRTTNNPLTKNCNQPRNTRPKTSFPLSIREEATYKWNTALRGFLERNDPKAALLEYTHLRSRGVWADSYTLQFAIKACVHLMPDVYAGEQVHAQIFKLGFASELITQTALLKFYGVSGDLVAAQKVFDETSRRDLVQWNALVAIYAQRRHPQRAIVAAHDMVNEKVRPNEVTMVSIISACAQLRSLAEGKQVHCYAVRNLLGFDTFVHNSLIDMYAKCGHLSNAHLVFRKTESRNVVSWTNMINAYSDHGYPHEALALFKEMVVEVVRPDEVAVLGMVAVCSKLGSSKLGEWVDEYVEKNRLQEKTNIANALIDMHSKCGSIGKSCRIFDQMAMRNLISWSAIIQGLAMHGHGVAALVRFSQMQREGFRPDEIVFLSVMNACSHAGLVREGKQCFRSMKEEHSMIPWMEHYGSMVGLLCKAGRLEEAFEFIVGMPVKPDAVIWRTLTGACRDQGNIILASQVTNYILELEPEHSGNYIMQSNLHAMIGDWDSVCQVRNRMGYREMTKRDPARSFVEVNHSVDIH